MLKELSHIVGPSNVLQDQESLATYGKDWLKDLKPDPLAIVMPANTDEVLAIVKLCNLNNIAIVPSGGRTGLSGGATATKQELVLSLSRMNKIIALDAVGYTITCQAGVTTQALQEFAVSNNLYFPVDFASKGSSQIGGNIATNAGGIRVLKYGNMRDWVLGLELVTPTGQILNLNGPLYKNNSGYDLKQLIIGSEGTLGIITQATLKLTTPPQDLVRVLCSAETLTNVIKLFTLTRQQFNTLSAFEYFPRAGLDKVLRHNNLTNPFPQIYPHYILMEVEGADQKSLSILEQHLENCLENNMLDYVVISQNSKQLQELMNLRELLPETLNHYYRVHKNDVSVPIASIIDFISDLQLALQKAEPDFETVIFGHIGDGNLHVNVIKPTQLDYDEFVSRFEKLDQLVYSLVQKYHGSIAAEHGVGLVKKSYLHFTRTNEEIELMKKIKQICDPNNIMNPGKIF